MSQQLISVIIPVCERAHNTVEQYHKYKQVLASSNYQFEYIFVVNANFSCVYDKLIEIKEGGDSLRIIAFSQNFGEANAIDIGAKYAKAEILLMLPAYEQVKLESIPSLLNQMQDNDLVVVKRWPRSDGNFNKVQNRLFQKLVWFITHDAVSDLGCSVRLIRKSVLDEVTLYGDQHRFLPILASQRGFQIKEVELPQSQSDLKARVYSPGTYVRRILDLSTILFLTKFNKKPLRFFGLIGSSSALMGGLGLVYLAYERIFLDVSLADRSLLVLFVLFIVLGVQLAAIGLVGETIVFTQGKKNHEYHIKEVIN